jgi:Contractile injection system tube protein
MSSFPGSPRLLKGALVGIDPLIPIPNVVVFQYNPDTMTRRLEPRAVSAEGDRGEAFRLTGAPKETITLSVEIDATDQLEQGDPLATVSGIHPTLAALEILLYPKSVTVIANDILSLIGTIEVIPAEGPMTLFVWGPQRILPVRLTSMSITEEAHDPLLNPIRAKVELSLTVLSYQDLSVLNPAYTLFLTHHIVKEVMAATNIFNSAQNLGSGLKF